MYWRDLFTNKNCFNVQFIGVLLFILFSYFAVVFLYYLDLKPPGYIPFLIVFHILYFMLLWSFIRVIISDPGRVPIYWGFFLDERQSRRRRYCLLCHSFKPERCHHCSTCQRCVLNMDHHCPWISNCVGFMNRKFFILFLFYIILTVIFFLVTCAYPFVQEIIKLCQDFSLSISAFLVLRLIYYLLLAAFIVLISIFFKFHLELIFSNSTTIDNLQRQRNSSAVRVNIYDMGPYDNFVQIFGSNVILWPFPMFGESGKPIGDGVQWNRNNDSEE